MPGATRNRRATVRRTAGGCQSAEFALYAVSAVEQRCGELPEDADLSHKVEKGRLFLYPKNGYEYSTVETVGAGRLFAVVFESEIRLLPAPGRRRCRRVFSPSFPSARFTASGAVK